MIAMLLMKFSPALQEMGVQYEASLNHLLDPDELWRQILGFAVISIVAPVFEEYFFRGTLLVAQRKVHRWGVAIFINGFLFSLIHANPIAFISLVIIGTYFASLTRHGIILAIFAHSLLNTTSGMLSYFKTDALDVNDIELTNILISLAILLPAAGLLWALALRSIRRDHVG